MFCWFKFDMVYECGVLILVKIVLIILLNEIFFSFKFVDKIKWCFKIFGEISFILFGVIKLWLFINVIIFVVLMILIEVCNFVLCSMFC